jgi:hypothetical protein
MRSTLLAITGIPGAGRAGAGAPEGDPLRNRAKPASPPPTTTTAKMNRQPRISALGLEASVY